MPALLTSLALAAGAPYGVRQLAAWRRERECATRLPLGPDGVMRGGEAFTLRPVPQRRDGSALLLHGFGDTPAALRYLGEHLAGQGWPVRAPLLPGHGRTLREFARTGGEQWLAAARAELEEALRAGPVHLVGLSMGGALAALLAADDTYRARVLSLTLLAPYLEMPRPVRRLAVSHRLLSLAVPYADARGERSIHDPVEAARSVSYGIVTPRLLNELLGVSIRAREALPRVSAPVLYMQSRLDNRLTSHGAESAFARLGSAEKRLEWLDGCGHIVTVDYGRARVFEEVTRWLEAHGAPARARRFTPR